MLLFNICSHLTEVQVEYTQCWSGTWANKVRVTISVCPHSQYIYWQLFYEILGGNLYFEEKEQF